MKKYRAIIWDWNGTLLDDVDLLHVIVNGFRVRYDMKPLTNEERQELFGFPIRDYYIRMGFDFQRISYEQICVDFTREYYARARECRLRSFAPEVIDAINKKGLAQSILSVSEQTPLEKAVKQFGIEDLFKDITGREDHSGGSKLDMGKKLISRRGFAPEEVLLIGDTVHDHEVARDLGGDCLLIESGYQSRGKLLSCGRPVLNGLKDVFSYITL